MFHGAFMFLIPSDEINDPCSVQSEQLLLSKLHDPFLI